MRSFLGAEYNKKHTICNQREHKIHQRLSLCCVYRRQGLLVVPYVEMTFSPTFIFAPEMHFICVLIKTKVLVASPRGCFDG